VATNTVVIVVVAADGNHSHVSDLFFKSQMALAFAFAIPPFVGESQLW
jgi:hypothetical protein